MSAGEKLAEQARGTGEFMELVTSFERLEVMADVIARSAPSEGICEAYARGVAAAFEIASRAVRHTAGFRAESRASASASTEEPGS